MHAKLAQI